jgi:hypothetical protein
MLNPTSGYGCFSPISPKPPTCLKVVPMPLSSVFCTVTPVYIPTIEYVLSLGGYFSEITLDFILNCSFNTTK